jgi:hypothetical protein
MRYPKEALVFENTYDGYKVRRGAIVELAEWDGEVGPVNTGAKYPAILGGKWAGVRVLDDRYVVECNRHPTQGWPGAVLMLKDLKPLTPAAREFLAIAKAGR